MWDLHYWDRLVYLSLQCRRERIIILHIMWIILHKNTSNDLDVLFVSHPRFWDLAVIPSARKVSSASNQSWFDYPFAVQGPRLWNAVPYHLNVIQDLAQFKNKLTQFMLSPIRGYSPSELKFPAVLAEWSRSSLALAFIQLENIAPYS